MEQNPTSLKRRSFIKVGIAAGLTSILPAMPKAVKDSFADGMPSPTPVSTAQGLYHWFEGMKWYEQERRLAALENIKERTMAATDDNFKKYLRRWLNRRGKNRSCYTGAKALMDEMQADPVITNEFDMELVNTGVNIYGRSIPIPHFTIRMDPKNGVGPSYLADRYLGGELSQIMGWEPAEATDLVIEYYARTYPIADSDFDLMSNMIVVEPLPCTSRSLFHGTLPPCPTHNGKRGPHCTIGSSKYCFVHGCPGMEH